MMRVEPVGELLAEAPVPPADGDKTQRGDLVLVAGNASCPGAALLGAVAALRVGTGRVQILTASTVVQALGVAAPEVLVAPWETGAPLPPPVATLLQRADAVCIGPGMGEDAADAARAVATELPPSKPLLLDALALPAARELRASGRRCVLTPNVREAQQLADSDETDVALLAELLAHALDVTVAVRGATTVVTDGERAWSEEGAIGLGTAGSGDVLAGIAGGLLARGLSDVAAVGWAAALHAEAGRRLAHGRANPGYIARELLDVIPDAIEGLRSER
jgi:hydroxyethylthiazole kinase-like uncharacterized protein yjeF